ncbi:MAG: hypothetical protein ACI4XL_06045 [Bacillus sp. (in: firmicutes)]
MSPFDRENANPYMQLPGTQFAAFKPGTVGPYGNWLGPNVHPQGNQYGGYWHPGPHQYGYQVGANGYSGGMYPGMPGGTAPQSPGGMTHMGMGMPMPSSPWTSNESSGMTGNMAGSNMGMGMGMAGPGYPNFPTSFQQ